MPPVLLVLAVEECARAYDLFVGPAQPYTTVGQALAAAASGDRILVDPGTYAEATLTVDAARVIEVRAAAGPATVVLRATDPNLFEVRDGATLTLADAEFDGEGAHRLALVSNGATLVVDGCDVHDASSGNPSEEGGAIRASGSSVSLIDSTFAASATLRDGGFLSLAGSLGVVAGSTFTAGRAERDGGAIAAATGSTLFVDASVFDGCSTVGDGGAILVADGSVSITGSTFLANQADGLGTVRCRATSACDVAASVFDGNHATSGAALSVEGGSTTLRGSTVCRSDGASVVVFDGASGATVENTVILANELGGAALRVGAGATASIVNNTFASNTSDGVGTATRIEGTATLVNNLVAWSVGPEPSVAATGGASVSGGYQAYWRNDAGDTEVVLPGDLVDVDPLVVEPVPGACDAAALVPAAGSPLVDAGDPAILDPDGSRSDIGAWGGPSGAERTDADGDGWYAGADCDEADPAIHPGQPETACNGIDDDCDPSTLDDGDVDGDGVTICLGDCDDSDPEASTAAFRFTDADGDGFGAGPASSTCGEPPFTATEDGDCDDSDPAAFPGAVDVPYDGVDQDCDGVDLDDLDGDGVLGADDCDDEDPARSPEADEIPEDGIDQDCTGRDATAELNGGAGVRCGCASGSGGGVPALLLLLAFRRRRS